MTIYSFFTDFMSDIFGDSQRQFHNTFSQTYGHLYERNAFIFRDYFQDLRKYYERGNENLFETTNRLFTKLYQKMFQVSFYMNKYYINEIYLYFRPLAGAEPENYLYCRAPADAETYLYFRAPARCAAIYSYDRAPAPQRACLFCFALI